MKKIIAFFAAIAFCARASAFDLLENVGDLLQFAVPAYALGMTMNEADWQGSRQFGYSYGATMATTYVLKHIIRERRPNKVNYQSFPSGHTASAFSGATFIHRRYGFRRAIVPYVLAGLTGISRVESRWHYMDDILAAAAIAGIYSYFLADYNVRVSPTDGGARLDFNIKF
ncbi:MAG: phosphatase PAP2 family protein [Rickettsiales bacterium]|jgi:membrane-associated phospholipid phosphatase|nr:phosphatase PAP2 family protein [Rickettsiales bacterium]